MWLNHEHVGMFVKIKVGAGKQLGDRKCIRTIQLSSSAPVTMQLTWVGDETILGMELCPFYGQLALCECAGPETKMDCKSREDGKSVSL